VRQRLACESHRRSSHLLFASLDRALYKAKVGGSSLSAPTKEDWRASLQQAVRVQESRGHGGHAFSVDHDSPHEFGRPLRG
jgi:hypothetical protein